MRCIETCLNFKIFASHGEAMYHVLNASEFVCQKAAGGVWLETFVAEWPAPRFLFNLLSMKMFGFASLSLGLHFQMLLVSDIVLLRDSQALMAPTLDPESSSAEPFALKLCDARGCLQVLQNGGFSFKKCDCNIF